MASWLDKYLTAPAPRNTTLAPEFVTAASPGDGQAVRYARGALRRAADNIATAPEGTRNDTLNRESWSIGQLVKAGHLDYQDTLEALNQAALECGLSQGEIDNTVPRAIGDSEPRQVHLNPDYAPVEAPDSSGLAFTPESSEGKPTGQLGGDIDALEVDGQQLAAQRRWEADVQIEARRLAVQDEARRQYNQAKAQHVLDGLNPPMPLEDFLAVEYPPTRWVLEGLQPVGTRALLAAQAKSGKTTTVANLIKALADGEPFLGKFFTHFTGAITLIDDELDDRMLQRWLANAGIANTGRVKVKTLRGRLHQFNIVDDDTRAQWAEALQGTDYLILDCLRPVLDGCGLDENHEAGIFLNAFDALLTEAGIDSGLLVHHMGHGAARSRGDSRIMDWPDSLWKLTKADPENLASKRYFEAFGREVNVDKQPLHYEAGALTVEGARPKDFHDPYRWVVQTLAWDRDNAPTPQREFERISKEEQAHGAPGRNKTREALTQLEADGVLVISPHGYILNASNPMAQTALFGEK